MKYAVVGLLMLAAALQARAALSLWIRRWKAGGAGLLLGLLAGPALACSTFPGYVRPSNFELVQIADAVVLATPIAERASEEEYGEGFVTFHVRQALKGDLSGDIELEGYGLGRTRPSDANEIRYSHPEGHAGPCNRVTFKLGGDYLLFLSRTDGKYFALGYPFSRVSEDYGGQDSLWARTVRGYLDIQRAHAPMQQLVELEALQAQLKSSKAPGDRKRAADVADHLGSISQWKPTAFLIDALERARQGRRPRYTPRGDGYDGEMSDASAIANLLMRGLVGEEEPPPKPSRSPAEQRILSSLIEGSHPDAAAVFEPSRGPARRPRNWGWRCATWPTTTASARPTT